MDAATERASLESEVEHATRSLLLSLSTYIHGMPKERVVVDSKWPRDWWQAFRERWFPGWWLKRHPVFTIASTSTSRFTQRCARISKTRRKVGTFSGWLRRTTK